MDAISQIRSKIDQLDLEILELIRRRLELAGKLGILKSELGIELRDPERESQVLQNISRHCSKLGLDPDPVIRIFRILIQMSLQHQKSKLRSGDPSNL